MPFFMTTQTYRNHLHVAVSNERIKANYDLALCKAALDTQLSITKAQRAEITDMQHFYNKGRAVHAADVRYEAKKRASRYANKTQTMTINQYPCKFEDIP